MEALRQDEAEDDLNDNVFVSALKMKQIARKEAEEAEKRRLEGFNYLEEPEKNSEHIDQMDELYKSEPKTHDIKYSDISLSKWNELPRVSVKLLSEAAQKEFLAKQNVQDKQQVVEYPDDFYNSNKFSFKDESALGIKGNTFYVGVYKLGVSRMNGLCRQILPDNTIYEGRFINGQRNGFGRLILPSGEHYWGYHEKDFLQGYNAKYDRDGALISEDFYIKGLTPAQKKKREAPKQNYDERFKFNFDRIRKMYGNMK